MNHLRLVEVLGGHQALGLGQLGEVLAAGPRHGPDHGGLALDLGAVQLVVVVAVVDDDRDPGVTAHVGPSLAADERVDPQRLPVPDEPDRRDVRAARPGRGKPAGPLLAQERGQLLGVHRDHPAAPLLFDHRGCLIS
jgi:hypothetical protein